MSSSSSLAPAQRLICPALDPLRRAPFGNARIRPQTRRPPLPRRGRRPQRRPRRPLRQSLLRLGGDPPPARPHADLAREPAAGRGRVRRDARGRDRPRKPLRQARCADRPVRNRLVARRPRQRAARRRVARLLADEQDFGRQRRGSRLRGRARRHPHPAQQLPARQRPLLPDRPGRRRLPRRHGLDPRLGHQRRALRHDEGPRAVARRRDRGGNLLAHRHAGEKILGGLRPHPSLRRRGGHARRHRRSDAEALRRSGGDLGGDLHLSRRALGLQHDHSRPSSRRCRSPGSNCSTR